MTQRFFRSHAELSLFGAPTRGIRDAAIAPATLSPDPARAAEGGAQ